MKCDQRSEHSAGVMDARPSTRRPVVWTKAECVTLLGQDPDLSWTASPLFNARPTKHNHWPVSVRPSLSPGTFTPSIVCSLRFLVADWQGWCGRKQGFGCGSSDGRTGDTRRTASRQKPAATGSWDTPHTAVSILPPRHWLDTGSLGLPNHDTMAQRCVTLLSPTKVPCMSPGRLAPLSECVVYTHTWHLLTACKWTLPCYVSHICLLSSVIFLLVLPLCRNLLFSIIIFNIIALSFHSLSLLFIFYLPPHKCTRQCCHTTLLLVLLAVVHWLLCKKCDHRTNNTNNAKLPCS